MKIIHYLLLIAVTLVLNACKNKEQKSKVHFDKFPIMRLTTASNGTYYFDEASENGPLRYSRIIDGEYEEP